MAQKFYEDHKHLDFNKSIEVLDDTVKEILALVASKSNAELYEIDWYEKWTLGRMIQLNTSSPYNNAKLRLRR